jgi:MYXO-CTERM domain-containing protein
MKLYAPLLLAIVTATALPQVAEAQSLRFTATAPGGIVGTGNTLGLSKGTGENGPGDRDSIGTFISLGNSIDAPPTNAANPWPMGTTADWKQNGSTAILDLPEAEVLYAELVWGGSFQYGVEDVSASLGSSVSITANGSTAMVAPSPMTALTISKTAIGGFAVRYYMRSADVTAFVKQAGKGMYSVSGVPGTQVETTNSLNAAGWTLVVAYRDEGAAIRNLSIFVGGSFVDENTTQDYTISGFCAPPAGVVTGEVVVSTIEGDTNFTGDVLQIAPTVAGPFVGLSGPNNPANNFFCSQINDGTGNLDTRGTFGMVNHNPATGVNTKGGRQGWDVTTVGVSSANGQLQNGQTSAVIRTTTTGDSYVPILAAFSIDVNAPDFKGAASSSIAAPAIVSQGDTFTVTAILANNGDVAAQNVAFTLPIENSLDVAGFAIDGAMGDVNGAAVDATKLGAGVAVGNLASGQSKTVTVDLKVLGPPKLGSYFLKAKWDYGFEVCANKPLVTESYSQAAIVEFAGGGSSSSSGVGGGSTSGSGGEGGNTSSGGNAGSGGFGGAAGSGGEGGNTGGNGTTPGDTGTCACDVVGAPHDASPILPALGLAALFASRRNRRRSH